MTQQLLDIGNGAQGTRNTLRVMSSLVRETRIEPLIRSLAVSLTSDAGNKQYMQEVDALFCFVRDRIRYVMDTNGVERVENPLTLLQTRAGDCDDKCTLLAALLESIGHPCRFCAVGYNAPGQYEHVYLETLVGRKWVALDPTEDVNVGWAPIRPYVDIDCACMMKEYI